MTTTENIAVSYKILKCTGLIHSKCGHSLTKHFVGHFIHSHHIPIEMVRFFSWTAWTKWGNCHPFIIYVFLGSRWNSSYFFMSRGYLEGYDHDFGKWCAYLTVATSCWNVLLYSNVGSSVFQQFGDSFLGRICWALSILLNIKRLEPGTQLVFEKIKCRKSTDLYQIRVLQA